MKKIKTNNCVVDRAIGLYIGLDAKTIHQTLVDLFKSDAKEKIEVCVSFAGEQKNFTFKDFVERLGFEYKYEEDS